MKYGHKEEKNIKQTFIQEIIYTQNKIVLFWVYMIFFTQNIFAYSPSLHETEPNNSPMEATTFSGEITLRGTISKDDQDAFMWKVDKEDSLYNWDIELKGVPNALTRIDIMKITFTKDGGKVENYKKFFSFGTRTGTKSVYLKDLLLDEGEYLIALSSNSKEVNNEEKSYKITFTKKRKASLQKSHIQKYAIICPSRSHPYTYLFEEKESWFYFAINEEENKNVWSLQGSTTIGHKLDVLLMDENNITVAEATTDKFGKYTLSDLELDIGKYYLRYRTDEKGIKSIAAIYSTGSIKIDKYEIEPNNDTKYANLIKYNKIIHGSVGEKDKHDFYTFSLPEKLKDKVLDIDLEGNLSNMTFSLLDAGGSELQKKTKDSNCTMADLMLDTSKNYMLLVQGNKNLTDYTITFSNIRDYNSSKEVEPNDSRITSFSIGMNTLHGHFHGREWDCFNFNIDKSNRIWEVKATGKKIGKLWLLKGQDTTLFNMTQKYNDKIRIKNLLLLPGLYKGCLLGTNGDYTLSIQEDANASLSIDDIEHEPNQNESQTNELKFGHTIKGVLESKGNEDYFHFTLKNYEHIKLTATPPKDGDSRIKLISNMLTHRSYPEVGKLSIISGTYPPGQYVIDLWSKKPSYGMYSLKLERLNPFASITSTDKEPNEGLNIDQLPETHKIKGYTSQDDEDAYAFPKEIKEANITISGENLKGNIRIYPGYGTGVEHMPLVWNENNKTYTTTLKKSKEDDLAHIVVNSSTGTYDYTLSISGYEPKIYKELGISLAVSIENNKVAAYSEFGQKVMFHIILESMKEHDLNISSHISDASWNLNFEKSVNIKSAERKSIPFELLIPKNTEETPTVITIKFSNKKGDFKTINFEIKPKNSVTVVNPYDDWGLPRSILGGINVARQDFGAKRILEHNETELGYVPDVMVRTHLLFDTLSYNAGSSFHLYPGRKHVDENISIALAGDTASEVVGVILNPLSYDKKIKQLKDFSISLSKDGENYTPVYRGTLRLAGKDQAFVFNKPYMAKYAKLTLHNNHLNQKNNDIYLGEWKVIAKQNSLNGSKAFNIAKPKLGGHVIKASQQISDYWDRGILNKKYNISNIYLYKKHKELSWTVGFKNERVAKITHMVWTEGGERKKDAYMHPLKVFVSTQTPLGPWQEIKEWYKQDDNRSTYTFDTPVWARYVKFSFPIEQDGYYSLPKELQIFEKKPDKHYMSILGEWGETNHHSFYEYQQSKNDKTIAIITNNETKDKAYALDINQTIKGRVSVANKEEDWYHIHIPKGHNQFTLNLSGKESVDVSYTLYDSHNTNIKALKEEKTPLSHRFIFNIKEGDYYLKINQPPVSVIFAWDNSGSVSPYHTQIFDAVNNYTRHIQKGIDAINLLCFNSIDTFILSDFSSNPTEVQAIFNDFERDCDSSDAEKALKTSTDKLKDRDGTKGVIIIGDAVGSRDNTLWNILAEVKPKIFSIRVVSQYDYNEIYEGLMQSWTRVNNGSYSVVHNGIELYHAIDHASAVLRRPVYYSLNTQSKYTRPLGSGKLNIVAPKDNKKKVNKNFAIELILDASGSMLKRIKGKRRITIAKDVLQKAVRDIIPKDTLVAFRVFGHKKADACQTDLEMPLQALNVNKTTKIIAKIKAKNLAKTPIADSLAKVADDLSEGKGKKIIILVTDGKETCDGDPAKVIQTLKNKGIDVRINIVGFAIDDEKLKEQFKEWARIGEGSYFDASDKASLDKAVKKALQVPYKVYDDEKRLITKGIVDSDPVSLKGGTYTVVIESSPKQTLEDVVITGEQTRTIILKKEK